MLSVNHVSKCNSPLVLEYLNFTLKFPTFFYHNFKPFEVELESFLPDPESDPTLVDYGTLRVYKKSRDCLIVTGYFIILRNLGQQNEAMLEFGSIRADGSLFPLGRSRKKFCDFYNSDFPVLQAVREKSNLPPKGTCPFPKDKYHINGYELSMSHLPPLLAPGRYYMRLVIFQDEQYASGASVKGRMSV
ncbi:uncharacterized protein LOC128739276 [Sabethes cyaneus]|uniref:uncharacterized protein LOC128739276 n=1 Tax=Sabethes cyaneus TaxID=53552 RepID=UPI00237DC81B|nr:uncharacterized protein LOC128739276 [Sabethes cyaneus]